MKLTIYRGAKEIGGTLIELKTNSTRLLIDAGYPLFLNGNPIDDAVAKLPSDKLLKLGVLPRIAGIYAWDEPTFDAVVISHAHIDHYGLLKYVHPCIPVYLSTGTRKIIELSQTFQIIDGFPINARTFKMYETFFVGDVRIKPYLMDHSAFDAAAFEFSIEGKTLLYSGDFRGHGRKAVCLDRFIDNASKQADELLTEGTMLGRADEAVLTENENGYRDTEYQQKFEASLLGAGFACKAIHTSGHASVPDIQRLITGLNPKRIIPIHTMVPNAFMDFSDKVMLQEDGNEFEV